ncbi:MAG TPA: hypothetical protein VLF61_03100 [Rhabdochlamydiaceae bacterium]|nr:hypothetical protein [Rhabdochlamydiaceae bacterium]
MAPTSRSSVYLYSPFSMRTVGEEQNKALLLQFILTELLNAKDATATDDPLEFVLSSPACFFPFDWSYEVGCLNKIHEHAMLLEYAFPSFQEELSLFQNHLEKTLSYIVLHKKNKKELDNRELIEYFKQLYLHLSPFIVACKDNEGLLLFLLKNREEILEIAAPQDLSDLLKNMFPEGLKSLSETLRSRYEERGFTQLLPEIEELLASYESS